MRRIAAGVVALLLLVLVPAARPLHAQSPSVAVTSERNHASETPDLAGSARDEVAVRAVVQRLFDGMRARDTTMMAAVFHEDARLYSLGATGAVEVTLPAAFVTSISNAPAGLLLDEVLHDTEVRIDGPLATVWTYYDFFVSDNFSHCGYDAIQLLKVVGEWKIVALADTRRRDGCRQQDTRVFPSPKDASKPCDRHLLDSWLRRAYEKAGVEREPGGLWHAIRRKWATERKG
jgi:hypothetical protein